MPLTAALLALKACYLEQVQWLYERAVEYETGAVKVFHQGEDVTEQAAIDYRHRAGNMEAIIRAYERLDAKRP